LNPIAPLLERYERALSDGAFVRDPAQDQVIDRLDMLSQCLRRAPAKGELRQQIASWLGRPGHNTHCRGLYLWGSVGRGKTWLMDLFHAGLPAKFGRRQHYQHFMRDVHARLARQPRTERPLLKVAAGIAQECTVLCLDEFNVQDIGDAMILQGLLEGLLAYGVVIVTTSNTEPDRLYEGGLQRERFLPAIALIRQQLDIMQIGAGEDLRLRALREAQAWFPVDHLDSPAKMTALFNRLAGTQVARQKTATPTPEKRRLIPLRSGRAVAWFSFRSLCEEARGASDYIALARHVHTVFVSDIPKFNGENDDAARRFIALIDELYDQRTRLIVSAAAEPLQLYCGERLKKLFERTASRLLEMREAAWLAQENQRAVVDRRTQ
jgi:cell division protein ZapE